MSGTQKQGRQPDTYLSYVLRLWYVDRQGMGTWRASLQSTRSGERVAFAGLEEVCDFLQQETRSTGQRQGLEKTRDSEK